jgi:uncharacterized protein YjiS (DUF1127 family)
MAFFTHSRSIADNVFGGFSGVSVGGVFASVNTWGSVHAFERKPGILSQSFSNFLAAAKHWNECRVTSKMLNNLTDRELDDIGITRSEISTLSNAQR